MIKLGERIKELRLRDGRTQDALASALGVTAQAVSRWEKAICYPDMEMLPSIANYFGVSIDELFGYDNDRSKKVEMLAARINDMNRQNNGKDVSMDSCLSLAREALIEFPGNETLTMALASALYNAGYVRRIVKRCKRNERFDALYNLVGNKRAFGEKVAALNNAVADCADFVKSVNDLCVARGERVFNNSESNSVVGNVNDFFKFRAVCGGTFCTALVCSDGFADALCKNLFAVHIKKLILERRASAVNYENFH